MVDRSPHRTALLVGACAVLCFCVTVITVSPRAAQAGPRIVDDEPTAPAPAPELDATDAEVGVERDGVTDGAHPRAHVERRVVVSEPTWDPRGFELGMLGGVRYGGEDYITDEALYGMMQFLFRWRLDEAWALVWALDVHGRDSEDYRLSDVGGGFDFGGNWYLLDGPVLELFSSFGMMMSSATVSQELPDGAIDETTYGELGLYVGVGADVRLGDWVVTTEMRTPMLFRVDGDEPRPVGRNYYREAEEFRSMLQWTLGAGYRF